MALFFTTYRITEIISSAPGFKVTLLICVKVLKGDINGPSLEIVMMDLVWQLYVPMLSWLQQHLTARETGI